MPNKNTNTKINKEYILVFAIAVFLSWTLHELAHWAMGEYLGYDMIITLNKAYPASGQLSSDWHYQIISAAGPILTLLEAILIFILMRTKKRKILYPFLFICFYMRLFATVISFRNPNDEARISSAIGWGKFTLPLIMTAILFMLIYKTTKEYRFDAKFNFANFRLAILFSSIIILTDMYLYVRLL